jgi:DNA modification methylase
MRLGKHKLINGDCIEYMRSLPDNCVDAVICDPPYGLGFMGKKWDQSVPGLEWAQELLRVAKPGAHCVAFGGTRTYHRLAVALEDAGWEIRDCLGWVYTSGFPKSHNVAIAIDKQAGAMGHRGRAHCAYAPGEDFQGRDMAKPQSMDRHVPITEAAQKFDGWGTALKPSFEPAVLARKPLEGTIAQNVQKWGTGALNIDAARFGYGDSCWVGPQGKTASVLTDSGRPFVDGGWSVKGVEPNEIGRWPANLYHCPKASRSEREAGCDGLKPSFMATMGDGIRERQHNQNHPGGWRGNHHPTVKPLTLFRWLVKLCTPPDGWILDPFLGSGTTMLAAELEGFRCVGVEMNPEYIEIIKARFSGIPILRKMASGQTISKQEKNDIMLQETLF